ncbi:MAG TPA: DUF1236 domain-containing protein [Xanthobacteraceae bacterium]|jgi:hypothetical protein
MRATLLSSVAAIALAFGVTAATAQNTADPRRGDDQSQRTQTDQTRRDQSTQPTGQSQNMPSGQRIDQSDQQSGQNRQGAQAPQPSGSAPGGTQGQSQQGAREPAPGENQQGAQAPQPSGSAPGGTQGQSQQGAREPAPAQNQQGAAPVQGQSQQGAAAPRQGTPDSQAATRESKQLDASGRIELGEQQQTRITSAIRQQKIEPVTNLNFAVSVGTAVPSSVRLSPLPTELADVLPQYRSYSFFIAQREAVIVDPQSFRIVAFVPLGGGTVGTASSRDTTESVAPPLSPKARTTRTERRRVTDHERQKDSDRQRPVDRDTDLTVGSSRSETVEVEEAPPRTRRMAPAHRYRYFEPDDRGPVVVDPRPRSVFPLFDIFR